MSYKSSTIALAVVLGVTYVTLILVTIFVLMPQLRATQTLTKAVQHAASNDTLCTRVNCDFQPDSNARPPPTTEVAAQSGKYFVPAAKFAAQAVAVLEDASLKKVEPVALPGTTIVRVFSGTKAPQATRMHNMAWLLQPRDHPDQLWLAFRGTQTKAEWGIDWDMELVPWSESQPDVLIHRGFYEAALELLPQITDVLKRVMTPNTQLFISGHSLGASLAIVTTMMLAAGGFPNLHTYVFAPPRVGNAAFVSAMLASLGKGVMELHAVANVADIIPQVPLSVQPNLTTPASPLLYAQLPLLMFQDNWGSWVHNHIMPVYIANIGNVAPVATTLASMY